MDEKPQRSVAELERDLKAFNREFRKFQRAKPEVQEQIMREYRELITQRTKTS